MQLWPRRHRDWTQVTPISDLEEGGAYVVVGQVEQSQLIRRPGKKPYLRVRLRDQSGTLVLMFFHVGWLAKRLESGQRLMANGPVERFGGTLVMPHPEIQLVEAGEEPYAGLMPVYPTTEALSQRFIGDLIKRELPLLLAEVQDPLPTSLRRRFDLEDRAWALWHQHFPDDFRQLQRSRRRLVFDEFLAISLAVHWLSGQQHTGLQEKPNGPLAQKFLRNLPFELTSDQEKAWDEISQDLAQSRAMSRLLQGDVGTGKTVMAVLSLLAAVDAGHQAAFMAPTELLAEQHYQILARYLEPLGVRTGLFLAQSKDRHGLRQALADHQLDVAVGTQALLSDEIVFEDLGVVVIDEQHRFGVRQRAKLGDKAKRPDMLVMTATPIPRTMALTAFGDLEISRIEGFPPGRQPIVTIHLPYRERRKAYAAVLSAVKQNARAYVVCSVVHENREQDLYGAVQLAQKMQSVPGWRVGLIHGQLASEDKTRVMNAFRQGAINVLVATSIIEVGMDVPEATVMVIENAERFGIAQLHQLRGRIGRGNQSSTCFLLSDVESKEGQARLQALVDHQSGLDLAEIDLGLRGPGEMLGLRQHGSSTFRLADPFGDLTILEEARQAAREVFFKDPRLTLAKHDRLKQWMLAQLTESVSQPMMN